MLSSHPRLLVAASPRPGLDVGATQYVRRTLAETAEAGVAPLTVSDTETRYRALQTRIAVFLTNGRVVGVLDAAEDNRHEIGLMMAGVV